MPPLRGANATTTADEKTPLISQEQETELKKRVQVHGKKPNAFKRAAFGVAGTCRVIISTMLAPGYYIVACFYDEDGHFSAAMPFYRIGRKVRKKKKTKHTSHLTFSPLLTKRNALPLSFPEQANAHKKKGRG
ncbi:MAG: hypothetical protein Q9164_005259 [Protoblastenia rupestris]